MVLKIEDQSMTDLIPLEIIEIKSKDPYVEYKKSRSSPSGKVSRELRVVFHCQVISFNYENKCCQHYDAGSHPKTQQKKI